LAEPFFYGVALYDPAKRSVTRIPDRFEGDIWSYVWSAHGRIAAMGARWASSIRRVHPVKER
jgi:hypothetical protein